MKKALIIPITICVLIVLAFATTSAYRVPTLELKFPGSRPAVVKAVEFTVNGVKCRGTSNYFAQKIAGVPGVVAVTTYARTNTATVEYDPSLTDPATLRAAYERPDTLEGKVYQIFTTRAQRDLP